MQVKVRYKDILARTAKAVLLLVSEEEVWFPTAHLRWGQGRYIICPEWLAKSKNVRYSAYIHIPDKIEPIFNQDAIDELRFDSGQGG